MVPPVTLDAGIEAFVAEIELLIVFTEPIVLRVFVTLGIRFVRAVPGIRAEIELFIHLVTGLIGGLFGVLVRVLFGILVTLLVGAVTLLVAAVFGSGLAPGYA